MTFTTTLEPAELDAINEAIDKVAPYEHSSKFRGMTYEQGVRAALEWVANGGDNPADEYEEAP